MAYVFYCESGITLAQVAADVPFLETCKVRLDWGSKQSDLIDDVPAQGKENWTR